MRSSSSKSIKGLGLKTIIFMVTLAAALVPLAIYGYFTFDQATTASTQAIQGNLLKNNANNARFVKNWLDNHEAAVRTMAVSPELTDMDPARMTPYLQKVNAQMPVFYSIFAIDKTSGNMTARSTPDKMQYVGDRDYVKKPLQGAPSYIQAVISKTTNKAILSFGVPIKNANSEIVGVLAAPAVIENISDDVTGGRIGQTGISYLVHANDGTVLAHPDVKLVGHILAGSELEKESKYFGKIGSGTDFSGKGVIFTSNPVGKELMLVSEISNEEIEAPIQQAQLSLIKFMAGAAFLSAILSFALAHSISSKIIRLASLVSAISRAKSAREITNLEAYIDRVGGAKEVRLIGRSIRRLTASIKLAMNSM